MIKNFVKHIFINANPLWRGGGIFRLIVICSIDLQTILEFVVFPASKQLTKTAAAPHERASALLKTSYNLEVCPDNVLESCFSFLHTLIKCYPESFKEITDTLFSLLYQS